MPLNSFDSLRPLSDANARHFYDLNAAERAGAGPIHRLPYSTRVLIENVLRHEDGLKVTGDHVRALAKRDRTVAIPFTPERVLLQDGSGIPVLADMATLSERAADNHIDPAAVSPRRRMDLVVDHALEIDRAASPDA